MTLVYVAGAYRGKSKFKPLYYIQIIINIIKARYVAKRLWKLGYNVLVPHSNTGLMDRWASQETFLQGTLEVMELCSFVVLVDGWEKSSGTKNEINKARDLDMSVFEWDYNNNCIDFTTRFA